MNLYSRKSFLTSALLVLAFAGFIGSAMAQKRKTHKLRATAVVEVTTDAKGVVTTHVVPVTILDNGLFNDASVYKATPRPMALENGIVYEAQTSGIPVGTATIISGTDAKGWSAIGQWRTITAASPKPDATPTPLAGDDRPTLRRPSGSGSATPAPTPAPGTVGDSGGSGGSSSSDDRPVLHRSAGASSDASPTPTPSASGTPASGSSPAPSSSSSPASSDRPTLHRPNENTSASPSPTPAASSTPAASAPEQNAADASAPASSDPDRPTLRKRDAPVQQGPPSPSADQKAAQGTTKPSAKPVASPGTTKVFAAISDTEYIEPRSFDFKWKPEEAKDMELKMRKLVVAQLPKEKMPLTPSSLKNVSMRSFDLDLSNDAVVVMSAELPITASATKETAARFFTRYVTVVARVDFDGEPQKVLSSVTDSSRLDVTPRLELVDAVDVDGDGNAELLFREYSDQDKNFIIYSIGRSIANKLFEGASTPLQAGS